MIEVERLTKVYVDRPVVDDVSFFVPEGQVVGFLGPNGAGKTTAMRMITAFLPPTAGRVVVAGVDVDQMLRAGVAAHCLNSCELTRHARCVMIVQDVGNERRAMSFLKRLFGGGEPHDPDAIWLYLRCDYCAQKMKIRVDRRFDLRQDFEHGGYRLDKEIMDGTCFSLMMARLRFDGGQRIVSQELEGGTYLTRQEYEQDEAEEEGKHE